ncbi:hypothetical protein B0J12DRAFT_423582 [Macrophomina phaseolina]|uniref:Uncharacterized protein n=1 Tax=Macrophomina phaseolina TaxID=35725 RepID=A0ABQ8GGI3_9PEZI|nr:hypothetical protein B0J12DRAFT_423582 [Macrophomina phaseolina]
MIQHALALTALLAAAALAGQFYYRMGYRYHQIADRPKDPCSISGTTTLNPSLAGYTPLPCTTFTGNIAVATDAVGIFALPGIEEIQGTLAAEDVPAISSLDLGDLRRVDQLRISNSQIATINYPNIEKIGEVNWEFMGPFEVLGETKVKNVDRLQISHTTVEDLSALFDPEVAEYVFIANNQAMSNVKLPNLKTISEALEIYGNAYPGAIIFPELAWTERLLITRVGNKSDPATAFVSVDFPKLEEVRGDLTVSNNPKIGQVAAGALTRVRGDLTVKGNPELSGMPFEGLKSVDGDLTYIGNFTRYVNGNPSV